jgi:hypothetical protein
VLLLTTSLSIPRPVVFITQLRNSDHRPSVLGVSVRRDSPDEPHAAGAAAATKIAITQRVLGPRLSRVITSSRP